MTTLHLPGDCPYVVYLLLNDIARKKMTVVVLNILFLLILMLLTLFLSMSTTLNLRQTWSSRHTIFLECFYTHDHFDRNRELQWKKLNWTSCIKNSTTDLAKVTSQYNLPLAHWLASLVRLLLRLRLSTFYTR